MGVLPSAVAEVEGVQRRAGRAPHAGGPFFETGLNTRGFRAYNEAMIGTLSKTLVLFTALLLVMPPGWCMMAAPSTASEPSMKTDDSQVRRPLRRSSCCDSSRSSCPLDGDPRPEQSPGVSNCCCHRDAIVPESVSFDQSDDAGLVAVLPPSWFDANFSATLQPTLDSIDPFYQGPRLHILKCVWRC